MNCSICGTSMQQVFKAPLMHKYDVDYYQCSGCFFLKTETPYWLDEAYNDPINNTDTGLVSRNIRLQKLVFLLIQLCFSDIDKWVDLGGGYGLFVRLMRDLGIDFYWDDPYTKNIFAPFFDVKSAKIEKSKIGLTAFEVFEHTENIKEWLESHFETFNSKTILFSTWLMPEKTPKLDWWYYGFDHGQHIAFYSEKSLSLLAESFGCRYYKVLDNVHIISPKEVAGWKLALIRSKLKHLLFNLLSRSSSRYIEKDVAIIRRRVSGKSEISSG